MILNQIICIALVIFRRKNAFLYLSVFLIDRMVSTVQSNDNDDFQVSQTSQQHFLAIHERDKPQESQ